MSNSQRIKDIDKEFVKLGLTDAIAMVMIGLGLHTKFAKGDEPVFEFLNNDVIVNTMFFVSVPIVLWCMFKAYNLSKERKTIESSTVL